MRRPVVFTNGEVDCTLVQLWPLFMVESSKARVEVAEVVWGDYRYNMLENS